MEAFGAGACVAGSCGAGQGMTGGACGCGVASTRRTTAARASTTEFSVLFVTTHADDNSLLALESKLDTEEAME